MTWTALIAPIAGLIDKIIPDPEAAARAKLELMKEQNQVMLSELQISMSAIIEEAKSDDPYTSRARPSFMYVFYFILIALVIIGPILGVFFPLQMDLFFGNVGKGFIAIPEPLWWTFSAGYLGYTGARTWEKLKR